MADLYEPNDQWGEDEDDDGGGGSGHVAALGRAWTPWRETETEALADCEAHRAAVVESSPEVAALRAEVAELEAARGPCQFCDAANVLSHEGLGMPDGHVFVPGQGWALIAELDAVAESRADERARTERDIAARMRLAAKSLAHRAGGASAAAVLLAIASSVEASDYPRLPEGTDPTDKDGS